MDIYTIPGKINVAWHDDVKAIVDTWTTYAVTKEEFREAVLVRGVNHAKSRNVVAWVVDSSKAEGAFSEEIQAFIASDVFPTFAKIGVKFFISINSTVSMVTQKTVATFTAKTGPNGLKLIELKSAEDAIAWLKAQS